MTERTKLKKDWSWFDGAMIQAAIYSNRERVKLFEKSVREDVQLISESLFTVMLIELSDLLQKASAEESRIVFTDNIYSDSGAEDVTELIRLCRNAAVNYRSVLSQTPSMAFRFLLLVGKSRPWMFREGSASCDFDDDVAVCYGNIRVYYTRHWVRAFDEVSAYFQTSRGWSQ